MEERRITQQLLSYWEELKGERSMPEEAEMDSDDIEDIWDECFLMKVRVVNGEINLSFEHVGELFVEAYGYDLTGKEVDESFVSAYTEDLIARVHDVVENKEPIMDESEFVNNNDVSIKYRVCLLPFGDETGVTHVLGGMRWYGDDIELTF